MKIRKIVIRAYRGIEEQSIDVAPSGAVVKGRNGSGKTTVINAVRAALEGRDIAADAIRKGSAKSEILIDIDDLSVRRAITAKGNTLAVTKDGMSAKAPQTFLRDLLGTSSLDPMDLLTLKGKERRQRVLAALPVTVTVEQIRQWVPRVPADFDCSGHGLEVIERVRAKAYEQRGDANKSAKAAKVDMDRLAAEAKATPVPESVPDVAPLEEAATKHRSNVVALLARSEESKAATARTAGAREKVKELRGRATAEHALNERVAEVTIKELDATLASAAIEAETLRTQLAAVEKRIEDGKALRKTFTDQNATADGHAQAAANAEREANSIEATIAAASVEPVSAAQIDEAVMAEDAARVALQSARDALTSQTKADDAANKAETARAAWDEAAAEAGRLDGIVRALTEEAPTTLLAASDGIPGLALDGDDVLLDGVRLDALCGAEQVRFCVEVARRANAKSKILVVDGLERLDPDQLDVFVHEATRDGWQLLGTRVDRGDITIEAIMPDAANDQAAE